MVDQQLSSILWVFMVDLGIFLLELSIFFCVRKHRGDALFNHHTTNKNVVKLNFDKEDLKPSLASEIDFMLNSEIKKRTTIVEVSHDQQPSDESHESEESDGFGDSRFKEIGQRHGATIAVIKRNDLKKREIKTPMLSSTSGKNFSNL